MFCIFALFSVSYIVDRRYARASWVNNSFVYSLSLGVYCTAWSYFGVIGMAARSGLLYLPVYLGPTLALIVGIPFIRRLIAEKELHRFTSIADLISHFYGKSQGLGAMVAGISLIGVIPYIALQLKAINVTFDYVSPGIHDFHEIGFVIALIIGTILLGIRKLDATERHPGLVFCLAVESMIKLLAMIITGAVVVLASGPLFKELLHGNLNLQWSPISFVGVNNEGVLTWFCYFVISASAALFLPRQFHIGIVENSSFRHISSAAWIFPLYLFLLNLFVIPIAVLGLQAGLPASSGDSFLIQLPISMGHRHLATLIYVGGFSAAAAMVMVETIAISTIITNHLALPLINQFRALSWLSKHLLKLKWFFAASGIFSAYIFLKICGEDYPLAEIGLISFVAVFQFAPATLACLYWNRKSRAGAYCGLSLGTSVWLYTLLIPTFLRTTEAGRLFLEQGPFGLSFLRPYALFGAELTNHVTHGFLWSAALNILGYIFGSALAREPEPVDDLPSAKLLISAPLDDMLRMYLATPLDRSEKEKITYDLFLRYFEKKTARGMTEQCFAKVSRGDEPFSVIHAADLYEKVLNVCSGIIGSAAANAVLENSSLLSPTEKSWINRGYAAILSEMKLSPDEVRDKISFHIEKEKLLEHQASELRYRLEERDRDNLLKNAELSHTNQILKEYIDRLHETQARLLETSKFSALGEMAGGIAHEINTPLATIQLLSSQVKDAIDEEPLDKDLLRKMLGGIENTTARIAAIIRGLRSFSRDAGKDPFQPVELQKVFADTLSFCQARFRQDQIQVTVDAPDTPVIVSGRPVQLSQVLLNLLNNARDAVFQLPDKWIHIHLLHEPAHVQVIVTDSGNGIPKEVRERLFQPFFTTKPVGVGTGLGLSVSKGIIEAHGGSIRIADDCKNTRFIIQLPRAKE